MDSYQPIYDAVRSRIGNGDIGSAVESAMRDANISHYADMAHRAVADSVQEYSRPCVVFKAVLEEMPNTIPKYSASFGPIIGRGDTPAKAMSDFDRLWWYGNT